MTKVESLQRRNLVLGGLALALALLIVLRPSQTSVLETETLPRLVPDLKIEDARGVTISRVPTSEEDAPDLGAGETPSVASGDEIRLTRSGDERWVVASADDYPASADKVTALLEALIAARKKGVVTTREERFGDYAGTDGWIRVEILGGGGTSLATVDLGKTVRWNECFARLETKEGAAIVRVLELTADKARLGLDAWTEARLWPGLAMVDATRVDVFQRDEKQTLSFRRKETPPAEGAEPGADDQTWKMVAPKEAEPESWKVENLVRAFTGMRFQGIVGADPSEEELAAQGLDEPRYRVVLFTKAAGEGAEPAKHVLLVGGPVPTAAEGDPDAWYVRKDGDAWVYTVSSTSIGDFRKGPDSFLPPPPDEEEAGDAAAPGGAAAPGDEAVGTPDEAVGSPDEGAPGEAPPLPPVPGEGEAAPDGATPPDAPGAPETPRAPDAPDTPKAPDAPDTPKAPDAPGGG